MGWLSGRLEGDASLLVLPGAYDAYSALLAERAGFEAVYCSGYATAGSGYGLPDLGLLALPEIADAYGRISSAVSLPVLADVDTGYGGTLNIARTVREMARRDVRAVQIEDQVNPKRCGHLDHKQVIGLSDAVTRILAAVEVGLEVGVDVVARTDALAVEGLDAALHRARAYTDCGATAVLVDGPASFEQIVELRERFDGRLVHNAVVTGAEPPLTTVELTAIGYDAVIHPVAPLLAAHAAVEAYLVGLRSGAGAPRDTASFAASNVLLRTDEHLAWDAGVAAATEGFLGSRHLIPPQHWKEATP